MTSRTTLVALAITLAGCGGDHEGPGGSGGGGGSGGVPAAVCLGNDGEPGDCAIEPQGEICPAADNPACAPVRLVEVFDADAGPCLRLEIVNDCDETLYSRTCIEVLEDDGELDTQCWTSTTLPGFVVDVGECGATGNWSHWSSHSSGMLDVIETTCEPQD